ncbi:MAG: calcineurin-like phosphoesterase C-terminal domain-containing protein [Bacteroidales bacterium]|nr:calcineurin-like phosphoesterase C-terminal domain-containing protein [Bacteroidales bacterium]
MMKRYSILSAGLAAAAIFLTFPVAAQQYLSTEQVKAELRENPKKYGGVYYFDDFSERDLAAPPKGFKPFYVSTYARHGARYMLYEKQYTNIHNSFVKALKEDNLTPKGYEVARRFEAVYPSLKGRGGDLSPLGKAQQKALGSRLYENYPEIFKGESRVVAHSTDVIRTIESMSYFLEGMREHNRKMKVTTRASISDKHFLNPHSSDQPKADRWFWKEVRQKNSYWRKEFRQMTSRSVSIPDVLSRLFKDQKSLGTDPADLMWDLFYLALDMQDVPVDADFMDIFTEDELFGLWEADNYAYYGEKGPDRYNFDHGWELGGYMLQDIIEKASSDIASGEVQGRLRFGHDGCLMALMTMLDVGTWHKYTVPDSVKNYWQVYNVPMAANLQLSFYRNKKGEILVYPRYNEKSIALPLTPFQGNFYRWEDFRDHYKPLYRAAVAHLEEGAPQNVTGTVYADGKPLAGARVSDGVQIVLTDKDGKYSMYSDKHRGVVFVITPSGYEPLSKDGLQPDFYALLKGEVYDFETHDFQLRSVDQSSYSVAMLADVHLSNDPYREDLRHFRERTMPFLRREIDALSSEGPVYSMNLGDFTHELFWGLYDYNLSDGYRTFIEEGYPTLMYSIPGNHDNDPGVTGEDTDIRAEHLYREIMGPTYYSMDIGNEHWVMMDNIVYINTPGEGKKAPGVAGARDYLHAFNEDEMAFLKADLALVPDGKKVILCTHCPVLRDNKGSYIPEDQAKALDALFARFGVVDVYSGHVHRMYFSPNSSYPHMRQIMLPATSGTMWTSRDNPLISGDGEDAGALFLRFKGTESSSFFRTQLYGDKAMRIYDMNRVSEFYRKDPLVRAEIEEYGKRLDYGAAPYYKGNYIYVNYWMLKPGETVEILEKGKMLEVERTSDEDPLIAVSFAPQWRMVPEAGIFVSHSRRTAHHMFRAKAKTARGTILVRVRDAEGRIIREETLKRPAAPFGKAEF